MKKLHIIVLLIGAVAVMCFLEPHGQAGGTKFEWKKFLPPTAYQELVKREADIVKNYIGKADFEEIQRGKVAALMIAGYTLSAEKADNAEAVRSAALRLAEILGDKDKQAEAAKLAAAIKDLKGDASVKTHGLEFKKYLTNDYYFMVPYMQRTKGGDGLHAGLQFSSRLKGTQEYIENLFSYLGRKPLRDKYLDKAAKEIELTGWRTAVSAELIAAYEPKTRSKKRDPVIWRATSKDMIAGALELAHAAQKKDADGIQKASAKVLDSCVRCHKVFQ